ncbi:MAG: 3'-5' exoribonuclease [Chitinispirillaceae bacterium]|nr:3'-5' exoribonuclease [Chitinispirillaceae bacterium]
MNYIMVDIEADGPIPGDYSMICIGAVLVSDDLSKTFYGTLKPISEKYDVDSLQIAGFTREQTFQFDDPQDTMVRFEQWIKEHGGEHPLFVSDNNGFDWMFVCWYFHHFLQRNPFGFSSMNLGSFYKGVVKNVTRSFKHLRKTRHTHHPVDDAKGNAEALLAIFQHNNIKMNR